MDKKYNGRMKKNAMAVTIKDVAKETNLAISTISKYINGGNVREINRKKIEEAIDRLGFVPNDAARGLRTFRTYTVGMLMGGASNQHTAAIISETQKLLRDKGYSLTFIPLGTGEENNSYRLKEYVDYLIDRGVDGLLITPMKNNVDFLKSAGEQNVPVVMIEERGIKDKADGVMVDCTGGAYELVEHLVKNGHQKIGIITGPKGKLTSDERLEGYMRVMEDYGLPVYKEYIVEGDYSAASGYESIKKLWSLEKKPTAVFAANYDTCLGALEAVRNLGICIPQELSFVTFDDFDLSVVIRPHLTAMRQPVARIAETACDLLYRRMNGDFTDFPRTIRLKPECFYRDSVLDLYSGEISKGGYPCQPL